MSTEVNKIFVKSFKYRLENLNYQGINNSQGKEININVSNKIDIVTIGVNSLELRLTYSLVSDLDKKFSLSFDIFINYELDQKTYKNFNSIEEMKEYTKEKLLVLVNKTDVCSHASMLISQITSSFKNTPLVIAPFIVDNKV